MRMQIGKNQLHIFIEKLFPLLDLNPGLSEYQADDLPMSHRGCI